ncbi:MAG: histidine phosphatase family protein [Proteobacteria bacterium]|nr:histidine phosphatase family protein [Pseudomonadota bacterium]
MKILYLLRHAHAEPHGTSFADFDRPLDARGHLEAKAVATYIQSKKLNFDYIMCSAALRTVETLEPLRPFLGTEAIETSENFYNSSDELILKHLQRISNEWQKVLYIGHNPGIAFTALKLTKIFPEVLVEGVTPATLVGFQFPFDHWKDLEWWSGEIIDVFQPNLVSAESPLPKES